MPQPIRQRPRRRRPLPAAATSRNVRRQCDNIRADHCCSKVGRPLDRDRQSCAGAGRPDRCPVVLPLRPRQIRAQTCRVPYAVRGTQLSRCCVFSSPAGVTTGADRDPSDWRFMQRDHCLVDFPQEVTVWSVFTRFHILEEHDRSHHQLENAPHGTRALTSRHSVRMAEQTLVVLNAVGKGVSDAGERLSTDARFGKSNEVSVLVRSGAIHLRANHPLPLRPSLLIPAVGVGGQRERALPHDADPSRRGSKPVRADQRRIATSI